MGPHLVSFKVLRVKAGGPLSLYLFILAMEALNQLFSKAKEWGFNSGFKVGGRSREGRKCVTFIC